jgi:hypothetical protein
VIFLTLADADLDSRGVRHLCTASSCLALSSLFNICRASISELERNITARSAESIVVNIVFRVFVVDLVLTKTWEQKIIQVP